MTVGDHQSGRPEVASPPIRTVLLHGDPTAVAVRAESLAGPGRQIDVPASMTAPLIDDLAHRGVVRVVPSPDPWRYDHVERCGKDAPEEVPESRTPTDAERRLGQVVLVGGGPGAPGLMTLAGQAALTQADVVVCDRLAPLALLDDLDPRVEVIHVGKIPRGAFTPQDDINAVLVERARRGRSVVRLKGGDGYVFGRGSEEFHACVQAGIDVRVVPGVSSSLAVPALAGIPVTQRGVTQGFVVVSGHVAPGDDRCQTDWDALAASRLTIVVLMGVATVAAIARRLVEAGLPASTPTAVVENGSTPRQRVVRARLDALADAMRTAEIVAPAVIVIGDVVSADTP